MFRLRSDGADFFFFVIPVYLQSAQVHSANEVKERRVEECSAAHLHKGQAQHLVWQVRQ
jgi:hypothetical protein